MKLYNWRHWNSAKVKAITDISIKYDCYMVLDFSYTLFLIQLFKYCYPHLTEEKNKNQDNLSCKEDNCEWLKMSKNCNFCNVTFPESKHLSTLKKKKNTLFRTTCSKVAIPMNKSICCLCWYAFCIFSLERHA